MDYNKLKVPDLKKICKERGLPVKSRMLKIQLVELLTTGECNSTKKKKSNKVPNVIDIDLNKLEVYTVVVLKDYCRMKGIDKFSTNKTGIINRIRLFHNKGAITRSSVDNSTTKSRKTIQTNDSFLLQENRKTKIPSQLNNKDNVVKTVTCTTQSENFINNRLANIILDNISDYLSEIKVIYDKIDSQKDIKLINKKIDRISKLVSELQNK